jgi:cobalt-zinc-cadmium efflux system membrane fusion protein
MKSRTLQLAGLTAMLGFLAACGSKQKFNPADGAPPAAKVEELQDPNIVRVGNPAAFPVATALQYDERPTLNVNGVIAPDVSRTIPVVSLASGRVVGIYAQLGDDVTKGQLLLRVQSADLASAYSDYGKAEADEQLARAQLARAQILLDRGAIARRDVEIAQDAEQKAEVDLQTAAAHINVLGGNPGKSAVILDVHSPASGTIVEQNVTQSAGVKTLDNSPNLFTIADLSRVWVLCDVYEDDLPSVRLGDYADIKLNGYPEKTFHARVINIGRVLDPNTRTAKVRLELANPGMIRSGMFVTATFYGLSKHPVATVPVTSILHLHDRDWVFTPAGDGAFRRVEVVGGGLARNGLQIVQKGVSPGQQVVKNALQLSSESEQ